MSGWIVFTASVLSLAGIYAVLAMVLNMEAGWAGLWDLSTAGLLGVGCYVYVIATTASEEILFAPGWPIWVGMLGSAVITALVALLIGMPALRVRGEYFLISTFAFAEVIRQVLGNASALTNGAAGINPVVRPFEDQVVGADYNYVLFAIVMLFVVATYVLMKRVGRAPAGRVLRGLRSNEAAARALGKNTALSRAQTYVLAGFVIGAVAPLYVWYIRSISPSLFVPNITFTAWTAMVIGGIGSFRGPILGAFLLIVATQAAQFLQVSPEHAAFLASLEPLLIGLALIVILRVRPEGLISERRDFARAERRSRARAGADPRVGAPRPQEEGA
jgi:branched-chain amino acid transport system permease protein